MQSIKLRGLCSLPLPDSPTQQFPVRVYSHKNISPPIFSPSPFPTQILNQFNRIQTTCCLNEPIDLPLDSSTASSTNAIQYHNKNEDNITSDDKIFVPSDDGLIQNAALIGVATVTSKILGLLREITIAAVFGIGPVASAFKYASVVPGFSASLLGGVNGPIHITMAATLSKLSKERRMRLFQNANAVMFLVGGVVGALVFLSAQFIIHIYAPGLWILSEGQILREIAVAQLKIMIPCIVLAGPVGLGFGYMSAEGNNILPSISPALSSMLVIAFCFMYTFMRRLNAFQPGDDLSGGTLISCGASLGVFLQWIIQVIVLRRGQYHMIPVSWMKVLKDRDVHQFFSLLLPAVTSSGLAQIASFTDLCFASHISGAAAGLSYAFLLVMAPLGLLSSVIVLPLLPTFSKLAKTSLWPGLVKNLNRAVLLCMVVILPIMSIMYVLAESIIHVLFERYAFDSAASALVSSLFLFYSLGSPFYIIRELLVAVFYALGDGRRPFLVSVGAISLNAILDWLFIFRFNFGAQGLALSTSLTIALSVLILFHLLQKKLAGVADYTALVCPLMLLFLCCILSGFTTSVTHKMMSNLLSLVHIFVRFPRIQELFSICLAGSVGMISFFFPLMLLHFSGLELVRDLFRILMNR
ncbi:hypothetical protein F0562_004895 [Nyssa sinensis]|uniref:Lipid II flippase MurJ n=1 Tax=Nyssa sinensis TaxID=561372 RepID=A0A5J5AKJ7_9ASTE|nr:hypothetical protein F0562_004895 [Nyssa sinensis]